MKKILAMVLTLMCASAVFAFDNDAVVRWKTIVGNITVSNNDAVGVSPVLAYSEASDRASRRGVLANVFAHQPKSYKHRGRHSNGWQRLREHNHVSKALSEQPLH